MHFFKQIFTVRTRDNMDLRQKLTTI